MHRAHCHKIFLALAIHGAASCRVPFRNDPHRVHAKSGAYKRRAVYRRRRFSLAGRSPRFRHDHVDCIINICINYMCDSSISDVMYRGLHTDEHKSCPSPDAVVLHHANRTASIHRSSVLVSLPIHTSLTKSTSIVLNKT